MLLENNTNTEDKLRYEHSTYFLRYTKWNFDEIVSRFDKPLTAWFYV